MKFYVFGLGITFRDTGGALRYAPHGTVLDSSVDNQGFPVNFVPPPDAYTLKPMDSAAQTAIQNAIAAQPSSGGTIPGLPAGLPATVPIWNPSMGG